MNVPVVHILIDADDIPRTISRRVKVHMIAQKYLIAGERIEDIAEHYGISLADIHAALAYYYDNLSYFEERERQLRQLIEEAERYSAELKAKILKRMQPQSKGK